MEVLRGLTYAPVMLAVADAPPEKRLRRICQARSKGLTRLYRQCPVQGAADRICRADCEEGAGGAEKRGAPPNPVGAESKYELAPMFYRVSGTFLKANPSYADTMIRINPNRSGADTVIRILAESIREAHEA